MGEKWEEINETRLFGSDPVWLGGWVGGEVFVFGIYIKFQNDISMGLSVSLINLEDIAISSHIQKIIRLVIEEDPLFPSQN